jgi:hypothetical protein
VGGPFHPGTDDDFVPSVVEAVTASALSVAAAAAVAPEWVARALARNTKARM